MVVGGEALLFAQTESAMNPLHHGSGRWVAKPQMGFEGMDREDLGCGLTSALMEGQGG